MAQWEKLLRSLGFNESEARLYLTSLEMGPSPVQEIAKKAKVSRVTAYSAIEKLAELGLMSTVQRNKKHLYAAESPERLVSFVLGRIQTMEATLGEIKDSISELKLIERGEKPVVRMFEGKEGIKALHDDIIKAAPERIEELGNLNTIMQVFTPEELQPFRKKLSELNVKGRLLHIGDLPYTPRNEARVRKIINKDIQFNGDITIYGSRVSLNTFHGKLITVIIESEEIANTMRSLFELAWKSQDNKEGKK